MIHSCVFPDEISFDFEEAIRICAELHVPYVEPRAMWDTNINQIDLEGARKMKAIMDRYGIKVGVIGSGFGKCSLFDDDQWQKHLQIFERQIELCDLFETRLIRSFAFLVPADIEWHKGVRPDMDAYLPQIVDKLRGPCERAAKEGITLSLETEPSTLSATCEEARGIIDAVDSPALTCCWDIVNSWWFGRIAYPDDYQYIRGLVTHLHIKDCSFDPQDRPKMTGATYVDRGEVPYPEIFRVLIDDGYDGLASVETHLFGGMADRFYWLKPATIAALRNVNRVLAEVQGGF